MLLYIERNLAPSNLTTGTMAAFKTLFAAVAAALAVAGVSAADSLKDVEHVVLFMQENLSLIHI